MKKIFSLIAGMVLAIGFASCFGDLHDSAGEFEGYSMTGEGFAEATPWNGAGDIKLENAGDVYTVKFTPNGSKITFCFVKTGGAWLDQINGDAMSATNDIPSGIEFESVDNGNGGYNATFKNLVGNTSYTMTIGGTPSSVQLSLQGADGIDASAFYISFATSEDKTNESKNFPNSDKKAVGQKMENNKFSFISAYTETLYYFIENAVTGEVVKNSQEFKNSVEYEFILKKSGTAFSLDDPSEVNILKNAVVCSNSEHVEDIYPEGSFSNKQIYITTTRTDFEFYVQRVAGSDTLAWIRKDSDIAKLDSPVTLKYIDNRNVSGDKSFTKTKITPVKVNGLTRGETYLLSFVENDDLTLTATVKKAPYPSFERYCLWSNVYGSNWDKAEGNMDPKVLPYPALESVEGKDHTYKVEFTPALDNLEFGLKSPESGNVDTDWREGPYNNSSWIGGGLSLSGLDKKADFNPIGGGNSKIENLIPGDTYVLTLELENPSSAKVTVTKKQEE